MATKTKQPNKNKRRFMLIVGIFVLFGPALGAVVIAFQFAFMAMLGDASLAESPTGAWYEQLQVGGGVFLLSLLFGVPLAYLAGGFSAIIVGLVVAFFERSYGKLSMWVCLGVAALLGGIAAFYHGRHLTAGNAEKVYLIQLAWFLAHVLSAIACWYLSQAIVRRSSALKLTEQEVK